MKRIFITSLFFCLLIGCSNVQITTEQLTYNKYIEDLNIATESSNDIPADINIETEKLGEEYRYVISIDNPQINLTNIEALVIHNKEEDTYPSSGIFEEKLSLIPGKIDMENKIVKGILLVGYVKDIKNIEFKILVKSNDKIYYYISQ